MIDSILSNNKECYICGSTINLHRHHVFFGRANRRLSDEDGCVVYLCQAHHTGAYGVHNNRKLDLILKAKCEAEWLKRYGDKKDFIKRYGKNYL